jgi:hypothetical protein
LVSFRLQEEKRVYGVSEIGGVGCALPAAFGDNIIRKVVDNGIVRPFLNLLSLTKKQRNPESQNTKSHYNRQINGSHQLRT